ncbi:MAG TPA: thermonuclease family protein [Magnetospirillum sp.]|nr:thermonuclease family protein [Magnetospirillum sp.]
MKTSLPLIAVLFAAAAQAAPLRCAEDGDGGACVWGRAEGFDGESVQVRGLRVQLMGIAAPSHRDLCANKTTKEDFPCNRPARKRMAELTAKGVACELFDVAGDTLYGRCKGGDGDLARQLVASGVVRATKDSPYDSEQTAAVAAHRGLWAAEITPPKDWETVRRKAEKE